MYLQQLTKPKRKCGVPASCKCFFICAQSAEYFAFAIPFCTFNKVYRLRQFSAFKFRTSLSFKRQQPLSNDNNLRQLFIILAAFIALTACNNSADRSWIIKPDSISEDSGQVVVLLPDTDSIHISGSITEIIYPSSRRPCKDSLTNYSFNCFGNKLKIHVPCNYLRTNYFQYTEGEILTIHYPDSSTISILCGTEADLSIPDNKTKGLHHKKVIVKGYQLSYENVPEEKLQLFNNAFELLNEDIK